MSKEKTKRVAPMRFDGRLVRQLMINTGLSREGVLKNLRKGVRPLNFLVADAWDKTMAGAVK